MKKKLLTFVFAVAGTTFAGCEDIDGIRVDGQVESAFRDRYPRTARKEWEFKQGYYVADFRQNYAETEAWFTPQGVWHMTETDVRYADLPQAVKGAFEQSEYAAWRIDDIDMLEYPDRETVYIIEIEQGRVEYDLYFTPDGVLAKVTSFGADPTPGTTPGVTPDPGITPTPAPAPTPVPGPGTPHQPSVILPGIQAFIAEKYPQARIVDIENEHGRIEVDIVDGRTPREVIFSQAGEWIHSQTEVWQTSVPAVVLNTLKASQYGAWRIDEVDHYLTPTGEYYLFELESGHREATLRVDTAGNLF